MVRELSGRVHISVSARTSRLSTLRLQPITRVRATAASNMYNNLRMFARAKLQGFDEKSKYFKKRLRREERGTWKVERFKLRLLRVAFGARIGDRGWRIGEGTILSVKGEVLSVKLRLRCVACGAGNVERGRWNVLSSACGAWNVERGRWNVLSGACGAWNVERGRWNVLSSAWRCVAFGARIGDRGWRIGEGTILSVKGEG